MKSPYFRKCSRCQWGIGEDEEAIEEKCCVGMALMQLIRWPSMSVIWSGVNLAGGSLFWQGATLLLPHKRGKRDEKWAPRSYAAMLQEDYEPWEQRGW
jgi:hypothetical protein